MLSRVAGRHDGQVNAQQGEDHRTGRNIMFLLGVIASVVASACSGGDAGGDDLGSKTDGPSIWLSACAALEKPEVETALGEAVDAPVLELGRPGAENELGNTCFWRSGRTGVVVVGVHSEPTSVEDREAYLDYEGVDGIGATADANAFGTHTFQVRGYTRAGVGFFVVVSRVGSSIDHMRAGALDLARRVDERLTAGHPGSKDGFPTGPPSPMNPCTLLPKAERVALTGWESRRGDGDLALEPGVFVGGPGGGGSSCTWADARFRMFLTATVSAEPVPVETVEREGIPVGDLVGRPAAYGPLLSENQAAGVGSELLPDAAHSLLAVSLSDGRSLTLRLTDPDRSDEDHRRILVALAKLAMKNIGGN